MFPREVLQSHKAKNKLGTKTQKPQRERNSRTHKKKSNCKAISKAKLLCRFMSFFLAKAKFFPGNWQMNVLQKVVETEIRDVLEVEMGILGCTMVRENDKAAAQQQTATHALA